MYNKTEAVDTAPIRPWRSWITQRIPIPENGSSNLFGRTKVKILSMNVGGIFALYYSLFSLTLSFFQFKSQDSLNEFGEIPRMSALPHEKVDCVVDQDRRIEYYREGDPAVGGSQG